MPEAALPSSDIVRAPRILVLANGASFGSVISAEITSTGWHGCDTFQVRASVSREPVLSARFWSSALDIMLDVQIDIGNGFISLIQGFVDHVTLDPIAHVLSLSGRDRSAALIEARTRETFANQTSSEIATLLAARHGLFPLVTPTTTPVGRYWQLEHDQITLDQFSRASTEWDLLVGLAEREGYDVWVQGSALNFQPRILEVLSEAVLRPVGTINGPANVTSLRLERAHTLTGDVSVTVRSWSSRSGRGLDHTANTGGGGTARQYSFVLPDLTQDVAEQIARQRLQELLGHERVVVAEMPGELSIGAHGMVRLEGTGTAFDQDYQVEEVRRAIDFRAGFRQTVRARAASTGIEVT